MRAMGRHGFPGIPQRFGMQLPLVAMVLREASALMRTSSYIYIYIYIYTHRESLVRNHEPCAKALGNYVIRMGLGEKF